MAVGGATRIERLVADHLVLARDLVYWFTSIQPLAVRRTWPLWVAAGIPESVAARPRPLLRSARRVLLQFWAPTGTGEQPVFVPGRGWTADARVARIGAVIVAAFGELASAYGDDAAAELAAWLERHDVDWPTREHWWRTYFVLSDVARGRRDLPTTIESREPIRFMVSARLGTLWDTIADREGVAQRIRLSAIEDRLTAYEPQSLSPGDDDHADVIGSMKLAAYGEAARRIVLDLMASLEPDDWRELTAFLDGSQHGERERNSMN